MIDAGVNAKALSTFMGHASVLVTYDRYGHLMPGSEDEAARRLDVYLDAAAAKARQAAPAEPPVTAPL
jgi:integrase